MSIIQKRNLLGAAVALIMSWSAVAADLTDVTIFESCVDGRGRTLAAEADDQQPMLVRTVIEDGQPKIHYNPGVLPRLTFAARLFLYSHECARYGLGGPRRGMSAAYARLADCMGLNTLLASDMVKREDLPALQAELSFTEQEWTLLPGPPRAFDLAHCPSTGGGALRLPPDAPPSEKQISWNDCVRACADRLWACQQQNCGGTACEGCMDKYHPCKAACGPAAKRVE
ncbi:MAG: hypothetical protein KJ634_00025 [Gammaproteobacteria bacterium]|nr:hypothetical protein [Gammaproteobacteria bacterium]MBU1413984.1 hypothetical protein [Gammaproteobacteria bacterium]